MRTTFEIWISPLVDLGTPPDFDDRRVLPQLSTSERLCSDPIYT